MLFVCLSYKATVFPSPAVGKRAFLSFSSLSLWSEGSQGERWCIPSWLPVNVSCPGLPAACWSDLAAVCLHPELRTWAGQQRSLKISQQPHPGCRAVAPHPLPHFSRSTVGHVGPRSIPAGLCAAVLCHTTSWHTETHCWDVGDGLVAS